MTDLWTPERRETARASCRAWAGTPHHNRIAVPGQGIDCINFVFEVLAAAGVVERFRLPRYQENLGVLRERNIMERLILDYFHAAAVPAPKESLPEFGDVAVWRCGMQSNHIGIVVDGEAWHVAGKSRVGPEAWPNVRKDLQSLLRFTASGWHTNPATLTWETIRTRAETPHE